MAEQAEAQAEIEPGAVYETAPDWVDHAGKVRPAEAEHGDSWWSGVDNKVRYLNKATGRWNLHAPAEGDDVAGNGESDETSTENENVNSEAKSQQAAPAAADGKSTLFERMANLSKKGEAGVAYVGGDAPAQPVDAPVKENNAAAGADDAESGADYAAEAGEDAVPVIVDEDPLGIDETGPVTGQADEIAAGEAEQSSLEEAGPAFSPPELEFEVEPSQLVPDVRDAMLQRHKDMPKSWHKMNEAEQRDWAAAITQDAETIVRECFEFAASGGENAIRCLLEGYSEKKAGLVVTMTVEAFGEGESSDAVLFLHRQRGKHVMLRAASIQDYKGDRDAEIQPDQTQIDWDAEPENPHQGDNSDLADAGADEEADEAEQEEEEQQDGEFEEASEDELAQQDGRGGVFRE